MAGKPTSKSARVDRRPSSTRAVVKEALAWLEAHASKKVREEMGPRYGIHAKKAFGVPMAAMQKLAKELGQSHEIAEALWRTGWYEARMVAAFVEEAERLSPEQMDRWCDGFDNWGICDTVCFKLFDRSPHAFKKVKEWAGRKDEFVKRAAFALLASLALHDKVTQDDHFLKLLPLVERHASDERNFVKKGVSWALRSIGRRSPALHQAAMEVARRLVDSENVSSVWVGKDAVRDLASEPAMRQLQRKKAGAGA